jgi:hypothetical protein
MVTRGNVFMHSKAYLGGFNVEATVNLGLISRRRGLQGGAVNTGVAMTLRAEEIGR